LLFKMSFTVGLDFGTHQTKVCIENATNPAQKLYEFVVFKNKYGKNSVLLPSIVQINNDDTVSYGFVKEKKCKTVIAEETTKPVLKLLPEPTLELPQEPTKENYPAKPKPEKKKVKLSWKEQLKQIKKGDSNEEKNNNKALVEEWEEKCRKIDVRFKKEHEEWQHSVEKIKWQHERKRENWEGKNFKLKFDFDRKLKEWQDKREDKLHFRYFKQATFSNSIKWNHQISADTISAWYLAYILFLLQKKLGEDFFVQMGIPSGINKNILSSQEKRAYAVLIAAYKLVELYKTKKKFLKEKYTNLLELTEIDYKYSEDDLFFYGLNVVPEAFAGLSSITQQKRIETGMNLLVDIGGGTTDVAFFTIRKNQPDIHAVISFPKGLNFVFEDYTKQNTNLSLADVHDMFFIKKGDKTIFKSSISTYHNQLRSQVRKMVETIRKSFVQRKVFHNLPLSKLENALKNRPIVFCGGGSMYSSMRTRLTHFSDIKLIDKNLLNIPVIVNRKIDDKLYTILATSFGLSIPYENEIKLTPIEEVFNHLDAPETDHWEYKYEHGLTDL